MPRAVCPPAATCTAQVLPEAVGGSPPTRKPRVGPERPTFSSQVAWVETPTPTVALLMKAGAPSLMVTPMKAMACRIHRRTVEHPAPRPHSAMRCRRTALARTPGQEPSIGTIPCQPFDVSMSAGKSSSSRPCFLHKPERGKKMKINSKVTFVALIILIIPCMAIGDDAIVSESSSQSSATSMSVGGGITGSSANLSLTSEGSKIPAPLMSTGLPGVPVSQIFFDTNMRPANEVAFDVTLIYNRIFPQVYSLNSSPTIIDDGESGDTTVVFNRHGGSSAGIVTRSASSKNCIDESEPWEESSCNDDEFRDNANAGTPVSSVVPVLYNTTDRFMPVGIMTIYAKSESAESVVPETLMRDAAFFLLRNVQIEGGGTLYLLSAPRAFAANRGITNSGKGLGLGASIGNVVSAVTSVGIAPSASYGAGKSFNASQLGATFLVLRRDPNGRIVDLSSLMPRRVSESSKIQRIEQKQTVR